MSIEKLTPEEALAGMISPTGRRNPYHWYDQIRAHGNLVQGKPGMLVAVGYAECARALRAAELHVQDEETFYYEFPQWRSHSSLRGFTNSMLYTNPPDHGRLRRLVTSAFSTGRMRALEPVIDRMADALIERLADLGAGGVPVDFMTEFAFRLPIGVIAEMLGVPVEDQVWVRDTSAKVMIALEGMQNADGLRLADEATDDLNAYFTDLIDYRRANPADDLLMALIEAHDGEGDQLTHGELLGNLVLLLTAGFDTTTHLIGHSLLHALEEPSYVERLCTDPTFTAGYVEECLRFEPPVQATSRWAVADVDVLGHHIPAGTKLLVVLAAGNRDPLRFPEPQRFDPYRTNIQPLTFAGGIHRCVGAPLARLEARMAMPKLFNRFPGLALAGEPTYRDRWLARGHNWLPVSIGERIVKAA